MQQSDSGGGRSSSPQVVVPNLKFRYSGVTATNRLIAPRLARILDVVWLGGDRPDGVIGIGWRDLWRLRRSKHPFVWHARRNVEMVAGVLLKALGWPLRLVFTSAAQRHHAAFTRWLIARMDAVIATSEASASYLRRPATVIHHGVDTNIYRPPASRALSWADTSLPGRAGIGCFGRVRSQKGTDLFVEAMCRLLPRYPDFTAVVVGAITPDQKAFASSLRAKAEAAGLGERILLLGFQPIGELPRWYQRISIFAFTSRNEGFGLTLLEAMAAENALVATRAGAAPVVVDDGESGLLVPVDDADALTAALESLMRDPQRAAAMGTRARARVLSEFSADAEAAKIAAVHHRVLGADQ